ncbi:hypothetical protein D3C76_915910 [compost metagenome]
MNQHERFEAFYADQHGVPVESMAQHRMGDTYDHPHISSHYRTFKGAEAGLLKDSERYRWLRSGNTGPHTIQMHLFETISDDCNPPYRAMKCENDLDAAIDSVMSQEATGG